MQPEIPLWLPSRKREDLRLSLSGTLPAFLMPSADTDKSIIAPNVEVSGNPCSFSDSQSTLKILSRLNLVAANRIINMDLSWNYASESQAYDRVHRLGQEKNVFGTYSYPLFQKYLDSVILVKRLVVRDTIEERCAIPILVPCYLVLTQP